MTIKEFFSFKTNKYFWVNILVMIVAVVLIVFGVMKWLDVYTRHGEAVVVPDVKGMTVDEYPAVPGFKSYLVIGTKYVVVGIDTSYHQPVYHPLQGKK